MDYMMCLGHTPMGLRQEVLVWMAEGFKPYGNPFVFYYDKNGTQMFAQAMTKNVQA